MKDKWYLALIKDSKDNVYIVLNDNKSINGFTSLKQGCKAFEDAYNANHSRSHEASMSACLHFIQFQPKITAKPVIEADLPAIAIDPPRATELTSISGRFIGLQIKPEYHHLYETGVSPKLIEE